MKNLLVPKLHAFPVGSVLIVSRKELARWVTAVIQINNLVQVVK
jgi:hypothetical protein